MAMPNIHVLLAIVLGLISISFNGGLRRARKLPYSCQVSRDWRDLYRAALFETDKRELPRRIRQAERALILRVRELDLLSGSTIEEQAIDDALYALRALSKSPIRCGPLNRR